MKIRVRPLKLGSFSRKIRSLPSPLLVTALIFGLVPFWSLLVLHRPWEAFEPMAGWKASVILFNFGIGPLAIALCALTRHKFFIPIFLVECCAMLLYSMVVLPGNSPSLLSLQVILIGAMLFFAYFLLRTDALYPLIHGESRPWRDSPRVDVGLTVSLTTEDPLKGERVVLQNCSLTGMELSARSDNLKLSLAGRGKGDQLDFTITFDNTSWDFSSDIAWAREEDGEQRVGLHIADKEGMAAFFAALPKEQTKGPLAEAFSQHWQNKSFRQLALSVWVVIILAAFLVPSARRHLSVTTASTPSAETYIKAGIGPLYRLR